MGSEMCIRDRKCTRQYQRSNDLIGEFVDAVIKSDKDQSIDLDEIYEEYKEWHKTESISGKIMRKKGLQEYLDKNLCKSKTIKTSIVYHNHNFKFSYTGRITHIDDDDEL